MKVASSILQHTLLFSLINNFPGLVVFAADLFALFAKNNFDSWNDNFIAAVSSSILLSLLLQHQTGLIFFHVESYIILYTDSFNVAQSMH